MDEYYAGAHVATSAYGGVDNYSYHVPLIIRKSTYLSRLVSRIFLHSKSVLDV
jgi:hypothetical protein